MQNYTVNKVDNKEKRVKQTVPLCLYKIVSVDGWAASKKDGRIEPSKFDETFNHLSTAKQLQRICTKYWGNIPIFVVLTVDPTKFVGALKLETNPGGSSKYYHLYDGHIPLDAVIDAQMICNDVTL